MVLLKKLFEFLKNKFLYGFFVKLVNVNFLDENASIETGTRIIGRNSSSIVIGYNFYCNCYCHIFGDVVIGNDVMIGPKTIIWSRNHKFHRGEIFNTTGHENKDIYIGNNVWIGAGCIILPGARIPDNCVVAAGSIVTKAFYDEHVVLAGNPAKEIKRI
ncbi:transacetylase [Shewanella sp. 11B5]|uniref:acyltransferase n=1 Tax=Shewanella sp. 11B5 TaxID=2058298 RepID=UPI000C7BD510|nr:acyltransferase [Shewanella sp. 11B5]PKI08357.1 transacetylase [Shewanella sp. 11B5]